MTRNWTRLIRFIAEEDGQVHLGEVDAGQVPDVGLAVLNGEKVTAKLITGSIFDGVVTDKTLHVARVCSLPNIFPSCNPNSACVMSAPIAPLTRRNPPNPVHGPELP
jgi:hypothetical protein